MQGEMVTISICIVLLVCVIVLIVKWGDIKSAQVRKRGKKKILETLAALPATFIVLDDVVLPTQKGKTTIDFVIVSPYAIFVVKMLGYQGQIVGADQRKEWAEIHKDRVWRPNRRMDIYQYTRRNYFFNPVKPLYGQRDILRKQLEQFPDILIVPELVFTENADIQLVKSRIRVIHVEQLLSDINHFHHVALSQEQVRDIARMLKK